MAPALAGGADTDRAGGVAAYFLTGNRRRPRFSFQITCYAIGVVSAVFALLILERVAVIPL